MFPLFLRPYVTPIGRDELIGQILSSIDRIDFGAEGAAMVALIRGHTSRILSERLPEGPVTNRHALNVRCGRFADDAVQSVHIEKGIDTDTLQAVRQRVCAEITLILYRDYIDGFVRTIAMPHCESHTPPKKWSLGSVQRLADPSGDTKPAMRFYSFWRGNNMDPMGSDNLFRQFIVPRFPATWQKTYEFTEHHACPHKWADMGDSVIAETLARLQPYTDPARDEWSLHSLDRWTEKGKTQHKWGKSFRDYWLHRVAQGNESAAQTLFRERILPCMPATWRPQFRDIRQRESLDWDSMDDYACACNLRRLKKPVDPAAHRWTYSSMKDWTGRKGEKYGIGFIMHWRRKYHTREAYETEFQTRILSLLPAAWRKNYKPYRDPCPYEWDELVHAVMYVILFRLHRRADPGRDQWSFGCIRRWTGPHGEPWGNSFYTYWRKKMEPKGEDSLFRQKLLTLFPPAWQQNYRPLKATRSSSSRRSKLPRVSHPDRISGISPFPAHASSVLPVRPARPGEPDRQAGKPATAPAISSYSAEWWKEKYDEKGLAAALSALTPDRDPSHYAWSLFSIMHWQGSAGEPAGAVFFDYWSRSYERELDDTTFQTKLLRLLPYEWFINYDFGAASRARNGGRSGNNGKNGRPKKRASGAKRRSSHAGA